MFRMIYLPLIAGAMGASAAMAVTTTKEHRPAAAPEADAQPAQPITRAEFLAKVKARFDAIDTNHDGYIEESEIAAAQKTNAQRLTSTEDQRLNAEFNRLDINHDGQLSQAEFAAAAPPLKMRETPRQIISQIDKHRLGKVSFADYSAAPLADFDKRAHNGIVTPATAPAGQPAKPITRAEFLANVKARFDAVDTNHDGYIEENEIAAAQQKEFQQLQNVQQQKISAEFTRLDTNHDGKLSTAEFVAGAPPVKTRSPQEIIQQMDKHNLGKVSFADYSAGPLATFNKLDANHDGTVTTQEIQAARSAGAARKR